MESSTFSAIQQELAHLPRTTFGVSIPALRKLAQKIAKGNYQDFLKHNPNHTHEERLLHAFVIGYIQADIKELLRYFKAFIPYVDSWDVTDSLCQNFKMARQFPQETWHFVLQYKNSSKEFESRLVSVILLSHFLNDVYIDRVLEVLNTLNTDKYYSQMGVAWAVATIMGKYPAKCRAYLLSPTCFLDNTTYQKSLQKIRESLRVSVDIKKWTLHVEK